MIPEFHPLANLFPLLEGEKFLSFAESVRANGLRDPITLFEGKILDGRNRARACELAGMDPLTNAQTYEGDDPLGFVVLKNLERRHLDEFQRAAIAAEIAKMSEGRPRMVEKTSATAPVSLQQAADMMSASIGSAKRARALKEADPSTFEKLKQGGRKAVKSLAGAVKEARRRPQKDAGPDPAPKPVVVSFKRPDPIGNFMRFIVEHTPKCEIEQLLVITKATHIPVLVEKLELILSEQAGEADRRATR